MNCGLQIEVLVRSAPGPDHVALQLFDGAAMFAELRLRKRNSACARCGRTATDSAVINSSTCLALFASDVSYIICIMHPQKWKHKL